MIGPMRKLQTKAKMDTQLRTEPTMSPMLNLVRLTDTWLKLKKSFRIFAGGM
jgi:hypothetical protein